MEKNYREFHSGKIRSYFHWTDSLNYTEKKHAKLFRQKNMSWKLQSEPREDKHNFFRAGNVSWKKGTSINISYTTHERNNLQGKNFDVLFPSYSQNILNEKFNPYMNTIRVVFFRN